MIEGNKQGFGHKIRAEGRVLKPESPKYKAGILTTKLRCSVIAIIFYHNNKYNKNVLLLLLLLLLTLSDITKHIYMKNMLYKSINVLMSGSSIGEMCG